MPTQAEQLRARTKQFAIRIVRFFKSLPKAEEARIIGKQVLRAGTSIAANYRAVCRARSHAEFISKWEWLSRRQMKQFFGWSYWWIPVLSDKS
jgi:hypothetical protein